MLRVAVIALLLFGGIGNAAASLISDDQENWMRFLESMLCFGYFTVAVLYYLHG